MKFLDGLAEDIKTNLLRELRILWTHASTAIEGNTLTLGETAFVLSEGLTIPGKSLKDHRDVEGHAKAVDLMFCLVQRPEITAEDLFALHRLVITDPVFDYYKPVGGWKKENNSTFVTIGGRLKTIEFSDHWKTPQLMDRWLQMLNAEIGSAAGERDCIESYARLHISFVGIHPFYDGNGRIARLVSNLPCLRAGAPPVVVDQERRYDYIRILAEYQCAGGVPDAGAPLVREGAHLETFYSFCRECRRRSVELVEEAHALQRERDERFRRDSDYPETN